VYLERPRLQRLATGKRLGSYSYYAAWQREAGRVAVRLQREVGFDVAHHVTMATDFLPFGITSLRDVPLVLGPLSGPGNVPLVLWRWLGLRGAATRAANSVGIAALRMIFAKPAARRAEIVLALNSRTADYFARHPHVIVEPNAALDVEALREGPPVAREENLALFAAWLVPRKGLRLALAALAQPEVRDWRLEVLGDGPDRAPAERLAARYGLSERVKFRGWLPRAEVLRAMQRAHCLLFPSMLDPAPWIVAEAVAVGTPVVALDWLGPAELARGQGNVLVRPGRSMAPRLAQALCHVPLGVTPSDRWASSRLGPFLDDIYAAAVVGRHA
jgi:glycosyltransferase involved in cell wall biosynthesis